jgi:hypothetical protein
MSMSNLSKLPIDTAIAIAKHKLDAAFALELEGDRERIAGGWPRLRYDRRPDRLVQYLTWRKDHLAQLRARLAQRDRRFH